MDLPANIFTITEKIRFGQSDPAGIVYYPQFFHMFNNLFEDWMEQVVGVDFPKQFMELDRMFPLVHVETDFMNSRVMGQSLMLAFILTGLGRSSIRYTVIGFDGELDILRGRFVTSIASKTTKRSMPLPDDMRPAMEAYLKICSGLEI